MLSRGARLRRHEVAHEIDVSAVRNVRKWPWRLTQSNIFFNQISVGDLNTISDLVLPPTIEPVSRARLSLQTGRESESLSLQKVLSGFVVGVDHDWKVETQPSFDISNPDRRKASLCRALDPARPQKNLDGLFQLVFAQLARRGDPDLLRKVLELGRVPITIVELRQGH